MTTYFETAQNLPIRVIVRSRPKHPEGTAEPFFGQKCLILCRSAKKNPLIDPENDNIF